MSALNIPIGHPLAAKVFGSAVFAAVQSEPGFMNLLSGGAPDLSGAMAKVKGQTSPDYPIVKVTDLSGGYHHAVCRDPLPLGEERYREALNAELNMELPGGFTHDKQAAAVNEITTAAVLRDGSE